mmetsp:Transcript_42410/g.98676  ORF Transcript_42410/g.98676 Transcript_42410/m.98676 type:complete len:829 (-) Transcript_42410:265-2751(-)
MWAALQPRRGKERDSSNVLARSLSELGEIQKGLPKSLLATDGRGIQLRHASLDAERVCEEYRHIDSSLVSIEAQARPLCAELATAVAAYRCVSADFIGGLMALLSRMLRENDGMSALGRKLENDVGIISQGQKEKDQARDKKEAGIRAELEEAKRRVAELEGEVIEQQQEMERRELESLRPAWQWEQMASDPKSQMPSQEWYEAELQYERNRADDCKAKADNAERAAEELRVAARASRQESESLREEMDQMKGSLASRISSTQSRVEVETRAVGTQSSEVLFEVAQVSPPISVAGAKTDAPAGLKKNLFVTLVKEEGAPPGEGLWKMVLPPSYKLLQTKEPKVVPSEKETKVVKKKKVVKTREAARRQREDAMERDVAARVDPAQRFRDIASLALDDTEAPNLNLRTTTRWIGEIWAARMAHLSISNDKGSDGLPVEEAGVQVAEGGAMDDLGGFTYTLYLNKYGSVQEGENHVCSLIKSVRAHRSRNPRSRVFGDFACIDVRVPPEALKLFLQISNFLSVGFRPDEDNGVIWVGYEHARESAFKMLRHHGYSKQQAEKWIEKELKEMRVGDPKETNKYLIDCDLCCEAVQRTCLVGHNKELLQAFETICHGASTSRLISLPRFMGIMGVLNSKLSSDRVVQDFERMCDEREGEAAEDERGVTNDQLFDYATANPLTANDTSELHDIRRALDLYWTINGIEFQKTLFEIKEKAVRLEKSLHGLESLWMSESPRDMAAACVYARMCEQDTLNPWVREPQAKPIPKPSFFRSEPRKLHIMKALMPPPLPLDLSAKIAEAAHLQRTAERANKQRPASAVQARREQGTNGDT